MSNNSHKNISADWQTQVRMAETIDLLNPNRPLIPIGEDWVISITPEKNMFNFFRSAKKIDVDLKIVVANLKIDNTIVVDPNLPIVIIRSDGERHEVLDSSDTTGFSIHMNDLTKTFSMYFNPAAITDFKVPQSSNKVSYPISFDVTLRDSDGTVLRSVNVRIKISGAHVAVAPLTAFTFKADMQEVVFDPARPISEIGKLKIANPSELSFTPPIDIEVEISIKRNGETINPGSDDNPISIRIPKNLNHVTSDDAKGLRFHISSLQSSHEVTLPVMVDYPTIGNPVLTPEGNDSFEFTANLRYSNHNTPDSVKSYILPAKQFRVLKNSQLPTLDVNITDPMLGNAKFPCQSDSVIELQQILFRPGNGLTTSFKVILSNLASRGANGAGIYIQNPSINVALPPNATVRLRRGLTDVNTLFRLSGSTSDRIFLPNTDSSTSLNIIFDGKDVGDIFIQNGNQRNYNVVAKVSLRFDYYIDEYGAARALGDSFFSNSANAHHFSANLLIPLYQMPNPEWLAIDFGTSAIVAQYGDHMLDLHEVKKSMPRTIAEKEDTYEINSPFLSSNLVLRHVSEETIQNNSQLTRDNNSQLPFANLALFLSPTSTEEKANIDTVIPCLKLIVGYDLLPNIDNYSHYLYQYLDRNEGLVRRGLIHTATDSYGDSYQIATPLANIDTIFSEVYSELLRYYIHPAIKEQVSRINRLVLTVPNTYTPIHLQRIDKIVRSALSDVNIREIKFVSESDAVACYYLHNWATIQHTIQRNPSPSLMKSENVLVYDIGAGTLDVTLFQKSVNPIDKKIEVHVRGKLGISKAGNYLDSLIASLLAKVFPEMNVLANPREINEASRLKRAIALKNFIKNEIKPALSSKNTIFEFKRDAELGIKFDRNDPNVTPDHEAIRYDLRTIILNQPEFKQYIASITDDFLKNFFKFFELKDFKIDTVLLSGRSAKLNAISDALTKALAQSCGNHEMRIIPISSLNETDSKYDKSKTIVVEGAFCYADHFDGADSQVKFHAPGLTAHYGIIYTGAHGMEQYVELLNPAVSKYRAGISFHSVPVEIDLRSVNSVTLVQSFSSDTAADWKSGNQEYITSMAEIDITTIPNRDHAQLSIEVDENSYMTLHINGQQMQGITSMKVDINSISNARSLWPTRSKV